MATQQEETTAVRRALKAAGYNARVRHSTGTGSFWLKISIIGTWTDRDFRDHHYGIAYAIAQKAAGRENLHDDIQSDLFMVCINLNYTPRIPSPEEYAAMSREDLEAREYSLNRELCRLESYHSLQGDEYDRVNADLANTARALATAVPVEEPSEEVPEAAPAPEPEPEIPALKDSPEVPGPDAVEEPTEAPEETDEAADGSGYQPGSYADDVARREARLGRKVEKRAEWAESRQAKAEAANKRVHGLLDPIPLGQPILVGHHSEKRHRRTLEKADAAMSRAVEHHKMAEHHAHKSEACARALEKQYDPGFCYRRIEDGNRELRDAERRKARGCVVRVDEQIAQAKEKIAFWTARLNEVGGMSLSLDQIHKGDTIKTSWGSFEVVKVNKKTVTIRGWLRIPDMQYNLRLDDIKGILKRAEA